MKTILYCVASRDYVEKYRKCIISQQLYCANNNYEYFLDTDHSSIKVQSDWYWKKIQGLTQFFLNYDTIILIDADCLIKDICPPIETILNDKSIYYVLGVSNRPNSGVLVLRSTQSSSSFIDEILKRRYIPCPEIYKSKGENGTVIWVLSEIEDKQELSLQWNCSQPNYIHDAYIIHYTNMMREFYK